MTHIKESRRQFLGNIVKGLAGVAALEVASALPAFAEEPKWTKSEVKPANSFKVEPTDHFVFAYLWDGSEVKSVKIIINEPGMGIEIPGQNWAGERWDITNDTLPSIVKQSFDFANNKKSDKGNNIPENFNIPVIYNGKEKVEGLAWAKNVQEWRTWGYDQVAPAPVQAAAAPEVAPAPVAAAAPVEVSAPQLPDVDPYRGRQMDWNKDTQLVANAKGETLVLDAEDTYRIVQAWNVSDPASAVNILVGPGRKISIPGPIAGTVWRVKGDRELVAVRTLSMADEKRAELATKGIKATVPSVWSMGGGRSGFVQNPKDWKLE
jgi:hypothetical protein